MESGSALISISALVFVLALIALTSFVLRKFGTERVSGVPSSKDKRLTVKEVKMLDAKNKLIIIERDDVEHLLLVGINDVRVVESGFQKPAKSVQKSAQKATSKSARKSTPKKEKHGDE